jgi:hypothetical protein
VTKQQRIAVEAVARRFSAAWEEGGGTADAWLTVAGERVPVDVATLKRSGGAGPRLRFDKVATRLIERLQTTLSAAVPDGTTVLLTITAPIRLPSKTAAALEDKVRSVLARGAVARGESATMHGNRVRIQTLNRGSDRAPSVIGFVHNPDSDPMVLIAMTRRLLELNDAEAARPASSNQHDRWLVLTSAGEASSLQAYRYIWSQLRGVTGLERVLIVFDGGRVEAVSE